MWMLILALALAPAGEDDYLGKWDFTVMRADGGTATSWLHVWREGGGLKARMVGTGGGAFDVPEIAVEGGELVWKTYSGREPARITVVYRAKLKGLSALEGTIVAGTSPARTFTAERAPDWKIPKGAAAKKKPGKPVALFNGTDVSGWLPQNKTQPLGWIVKDGALDNQGKANNIYSEQKFKDFRLEVEFNVAARSNSGIYIRGRHEVQVLDDYGQPPESHGNGSIYGFIAPKSNASKPAGEWQAFNITVVGNRVTVILNGTTIIDDEEIPGVTGGALDSREAEPGPVLLQGDHGPVRYRKVVVTPLN
jgi:hypothetical protein